MFEWILKKLFDSGISALNQQLFPTDLPARLAAVADAWWETLPLDLQAGEARAVLFTTYRYPTGIEPPVSLVARKIDRSQVPTAEDWSADLLQHWTWVKANIGDTSPFFLLDETAASSHLRTLAEKLALECVRDQKLFQGQSLQDHTLQSHQMAEVRSQLAGLTALVSSLQGERGDAGYHGEIDAAVKFTQDGNPDVAIAQLDQLRTRYFDRMTDREKFRVLANIGHAYNAKQDYATAADHFIKSAAFQPADEKARCLEAAAYGMLGDNDGAVALADKIIGDLGSSDLAWATRLRCKVDDRPIQEIENEVPVSLLKNTETSFALATIAIRRGEFDAAEKYARLNWREDDKSAAAAEQLAVVLINRARRMTNDVFLEAVPSEAVALIAEADGLLDFALSKASAQSRHLHGQLRYLKGLCARLSGDHSAAERHLRAAHDADDQDSDYQCQLVLTLHDLGRPQDGIRILEDGAKAGVESRRNALLASLLLSRGQSNDVARATSLLEDVVPHLTTIAMPMRLNYMTQLLYCYAKTGRNLDAERRLDTLPPGVFDEASMHLMRASVKRRSGDVNGALGEIKQSIENRSVSDDVCTKTVLVDELLALHRWSDAIEILKEFVSPETTSLYRHELIRCAVAVGDDFYALQFCEQLRKRGLFDHEILHLELDKLQEYHSYAAAIEVTRDFLSRVDEESALTREIRMRQSHFALALDLEELVCFDAAMLPSVEEADASVGLGVVHVLRQGPSPTEAVRYAYELVRRHFSAAQAHQAMVYSILRPARQLDIDDPGTVGPGTAVKYKDNSSDETAWIVIEDGTNPESSRDEYQRDHPICLAMSGKKVGDEFALRSDGIVDKTAQILEVWSKYKYRFNCCMQEWETRFPGSPFLWKMSCRDNPDGTPDLSEVLRMVDRRREQEQQFLENYRTHPFSTSTVALLRGQSTLEALDFIFGEDLPVRCCSGSFADVTAADEALRADQSPIILDASALATLLVTDSCGKLPCFGRELIVSEGTLLELKELKRSLLSPPGSESSPGPAAVTRASALQALIAFLEGKCRIEDGLSLARLPKNERERLSSVLGVPAAETLAIAREKGYVVWSDDLAVGVFAADVGVRRAWSDVVFRWAQNAGKLSSAVVSRLVTGLITHRYEYIGMSSDLFVSIGWIYNWDLANPKFEAVFRWFEGLSTADTALRDLAGNLMLRMYGEKSLAPHAAPVVCALAHHISQRKDGKRILRMISEEILNAVGIHGTLLIHLTLAFHLRLRPVPPVEVIVGRRKRLRRRR